MKRNIILCTVILLLMMTGCSKKGELNVIIGKWKLDGAKTQKELEKVGADLTAVFGTSILQYGAGAELREDGFFSFHEGINIGGEGSYSYEDGLIAVEYEPNSLGVEELEVELFYQKVDEQDYLILKLYGYELYLIRE